MLDIQAIIDRHLTDEKMQGKTFYEGHIVIDLNNAIEEIKELRAALTTMQGAYELGVDTERAAVVAWLRDNEDAWSMPTWQLADAIDRGPRRREEEEE